MTTIAQWRRRCIAAEERAESAERITKRTRAKVTKTSAELAEMTEAHDELYTFAQASSRILERLAKTHLGPGAKLDDVHALVHRWIDDDAKKARRPKSVAVQFTFNTDELLRRLGFDPSEGEDE
jgi:multidrug resistance efflux pump